LFRVGGVAQVVELLPSKQKDVLGEKRGFIQMCMSARLRQKGLELEASIGL
jgi:hypothetical protein